MRRSLLATTALACLAVAGCDMPDTSDKRMNRQQEQASADAASQVGFPAITRFQEKRMMKQILELRDNAISTTTYIVDRDAKLHFFCDSIGFGLPYATEFTSPQKRDYNGNSNVVLPQADPNGLFSPAAAEGTWILCRDPNPDKAQNRGTLPLYVEPRVIVSPFALPQAVR